jgi:hypothetical protein
MKINTDNLMAPTRNGWFYYGCFTSVVWVILILFRLFTGQYSIAIGQSISLSILIYILVRTTKTWNKNIALHNAEMEKIKGVIK